MHKRSRVVCDIFDDVLDMIGQIGDKKADTTKTKLLNIKSDIFKALEMI